MLGESRRDQQIRTVEISDVEIQDENMPKMIGEYHYDSNHVRVWWFRKPATDGSNINVTWGSRDAPKTAWLTVKIIRDKAADGRGDWPQLLAVVEAFVGGGTKWARLRSRVRAYQRKQCQR